MNRIATLGAGLLGVILTTGCFETPGGDGNATGPIYRHHFLGGAELKKGTNATTLLAVAALPRTLELRRHVIAKLARTPQQLWTNRLPASAPDQSALLAPLLDDLLVAESLAEVRGSTAAAECLLAVQLNDTRAALWSTNLWKVAAAWHLGTPADISVPGGKGWEARQGRQIVQFLRSGGWVLLSLGQEKPKLAPELAQQIARTGRPAPKLEDSFLKLTLDFPRLAHWFPGLAQYRLPLTELTYRGRGENVRLEGRLLFSQNLPLKIEPWKIPVEAIRDPVASFTAVRGVAALLTQSPGMAATRLNPIPNQFCLWGTRGRFAQTQLSFPVRDGTNTLLHLRSTLPDALNLYFDKGTVNVVMPSNRTELMFRTVPIIAPALRPVRLQNQDYLLGSLFPRLANTNRAPAELFAQLEGKTNLVYYDWEITEQRLLHGRQLYSVLNALQRRQNHPPSAPTVMWMTNAAPLLGNTVTEISQTGPRELSLVRKSHLGFTGFELASLARWIESPGFPLTHEPPPRLAATNRVEQPPRPIPGRSAPARPQPARPPGAAP
ncbi:MAG TPA: hypothetical protein VNO52_08285 [Methylomirabilota bacterium]|nr:hypothetical protein [Methylomirabilota bacterium]